MDIGYSLKASEVWCTLITFLCNSTGKISLAQDNKVAKPYFEARKQLQQRPTFGVL